MDIRNHPLICLIFIFIFFPGFAAEGHDQEKTQRTEGIKTILNPPVPLKGSIKLKLEKIREINPYDFPEVGLRTCAFTRSPQGEVILFDPFSTEAHLFGPNGKYQKPVSRQGQGPGEFIPNQNLVFHFYGNRIWGSSHNKIAKFDRNGELLDEQTFVDAASLFIENRDIILDEFHHICIKSERLEGGEQRRIILEPLFQEKNGESIVFVKEVRDWAIHQEMTYFTNEWATPNLLFSYCFEGKKLYTAVSSEYSITAYDLTARPLYRIQIPHKPVRIGRREKEILIPWAAKDKRNEWALEAFPDKLAAILSIHTLTGGLLAVLRITGPEAVEIDIFDSKGNYIHALQVPEGMSLEKVQFFDRGFATQEMQDGFPIYAEFRILNVPEIFK